MPRSCSKKGYVPNPGSWWPCVIRKRRTARRNAEGRSRAACRKKVKSLRIVSDRAADRGRAPMLSFAPRVPEKIDEDLDRGLRGHGRRRRDGPLAARGVRLRRGAVLAAAVVSGIVLLCVAIAALFRATMRRLSLRLAFSYFLIGIVPIPLLAMLLFCAAYILAHQFIATRVRREVTTMTRELAAARQPPRHSSLRRDGGLLGRRLDPGGREGRLGEDGQRIPAGPRAGRARLDGGPGSDLGTGNVCPRARDRSGEFAQRLADRTGYVVWIAQERATTKERRLADGFRFHGGRGLPGEGGGPAVRLDPSRGRGPRPRVGRRRLRRERRLSSLAFRQGT